MLCISFQSLTSNSWSSILRTLFKQSNGLCHLQTLDCRYPAGLVIAMTQRTKRLFHLDLTVTHGKLHTMETIILKTPRWNTSSAVPRDLPTCDCRQCFNLTQFFSSGIRSVMAMTVVGLVPSVTAKPYSHTFATAVTNEHYQMPVCTAGWHHYSSWSVCRRLLR